jgi:uncharacterized protein
MLRFRPLLNGVGIFVLAVVTATALSPAEGASFDCTRASTLVESLICTDPNLSQLDDRVAVAYSSMRIRSTNPQELVAAQRVWLVQRNQCQSVACIEDQYTKRLAALGVSLRSNAQLVAGFDGSLLGLL